MTVAAYIAAVLVARDAKRSGLNELHSYFRMRAMIAGVAAGTVALAGIYIIETDAPTLAHGLTSLYGIGVITLSAVAGAGSLVAIYTKRTQLSRPLAIVAAVAVLWGWAVGQYPWLIPDVLTIEAGAASDVVLVALLIAFAAASVIAVPPLMWLLALPDRGVLDADLPIREGSSDALLSELASDGNM